MTLPKRKTIYLFALSLALVAVAVFWTSAPEAQAAENNQKTAFEAVFGGLKLVQAPGLSTIAIIAEEETLSRHGVDSPGTVEVAGSKANVFALDGRTHSSIKMRPGILRGAKFEPASPWLTNPGLSQSTPTAYVCYQQTRTATT